MKQNSSVVKSQGESISGKLFLSGQGPLLALMILLSLLFSPGLLLAQEFLVKNINNMHQETVGSAPQFFVPVGSNVFYFRANDGIHGTELWRSDGTAEGTALVADITGNSANADPASLVNVSGTLFFTAADAAHGRELWKSDGTAGGTVLVADIAPGAASSNPTNLVALSNLLFFSATVSNGIGAELWVSDGTSLGTRLVKDINPGAASSNPANLIAFNNILIFSATTSSNGVEVWKSDGTASGTGTVRDINPGAASSNPANFALGNLFTTNFVYFTANGGATNGVELWRTDGTTAGTLLVKDINPGPASSNPTNLVNVDGTLFFAATVTTNGANTGTELWKSDGTAAGTVLVKDIGPGPTNSTPQNLVNVNGTLFFTALDSSSGRELWKSDGTSNGTVMVLDIAPPRRAPCRRTS